MSQFVVISDTHAHPWAAFSKGEGLENSRLQRTLTVLDDSLRKAQELGVPWLFAGDLVHTAGYTLNVVSSGVTSVLSRYPDVPKGACWGNHDARGVGGVISLEQTVWASLLKSVPNLTVFEDGENEMEWEGLTIRGAGYQPRGDLLQVGPGADIGIFHQTVRGSVTPGGYELQEGIPRQLLEERFRIAIVGHVHHAQQLPAAEDRAILIPGSPEHHNFGDQGEHGWWILTLEKEGKPSVEFFPGGSPQFLTVEDPSGIVSGDGNFYRVKTVRSKESLPENATFIAPQPTSVAQRDLLRDISEIEQILQVWFETNPPDREEVDSEGWLTVGRLLLEGHEPIRMRPMRLSQLRLTNFCSYEDQEFRVEEGLWLVTGKGRDYPSNGAGKTTLTGEALYWLVTGKNTKGLGADEVIRYDQSHCSVRGVFYEGESHLEVERSRGSSGPSLTVNHDGVEWEAATANEMTDKLLRFLGLTPEIFQNLGYFSQEKILLFSSATDGERKNVLTDLIGLSSYQEASSAAAARISEQDRVKVQKEAYRDAQVEQLESEKKDVLLYATRIEEWLSAQKEKITALENSLEELSNDSRIKGYRERLDSVRTRGEALLAAFRARVEEEIPEKEKVAQSRLLGGVRTRLEELTRLREEKLKSVRETYGDSTEKLLSTLPDAEKIINTWEERVTACTTQAEEARKARTLLAGERQAWTREMSEAEKAYTKVEEALNQGTCLSCGQKIDEEHREACLENAAAPGWALKERNKELEERDRETKAAVVIAETALTEAQEHLANFKAHVTKLKTLQGELQQVGSWAEEEKRLEAQVESLSEVAEKEVRAETDKLLSDYSRRKEALLLRAEKFVDRILQEHNNQVTMVTQQIAQERERENPHSREYESAALRVVAVEGKIEEVCRVIEETVESIDIYDYWKRAFSKQGIQSLLLEEIATLFNKNRGEIFPVLTQGVYDVQFSTVSRTRAGEAREKTEFIVHEHGRLIPYGALSGGQRRRIDLGIMLVMSQSVSEWMRVPGVLGVLTMDEVFGFLDQSGAEGLVEALSSVQKQIPTIFAVAHDPQLQSLFPNTIRVEQGEDGISRMVG